MVLGELNLYLQDVFPEAVNHDVPNKYINDVADFLAEQFEGILAEQPTNGS